jgi:hypothetical protein
MTREPATGGHGLSQSRKRLASGALPNRRSLFANVGLGALGMGLADLLRCKARAAPALGRARSCVFLFLNGGASHIDLWDMKPNAPAEVRGEFRPIATAVPGLELCEHLPLTARLTQHLALVRTVQMTGVENSHGWGFYYMQTGHPPDPSRYVGEQLDPRADDWPFLGSVVASLRQANRSTREEPLSSAVPRAVQAPWIWDLASNRPYFGNFAGRLGRSFDPLQVAFDPRTSALANSSMPLFAALPAQARWARHAVPGLTLPEEISADRLASRRGLLGALDRFEREWEGHAAMRGYSRYEAQAYTLITSSAARKALHIEEEPDHVRDRYGGSINGQSALLCRRLVEAGIPFVNLQWMAPRNYFYNWDTHVENFRALRECLLPDFDRAFSALLWDLQERGLLEETLVVVASDMGRTPRVGDTLSPSGRNHWNMCQTVLFAGGGVRGGQLYGASDAIAAYPKDNPARPEHVAATIYQALGLYDSLWARDAQGRPYHLLEQGHPLPLFG